MSEIRYPAVTVHLSTGRDGNAYGIVAAVSKALRREIGSDAATDFAETAMGCGSYDDLLTLVHQTVNVT